jgi:hypothetical protein
MEEQKAAVVADNSAFDPSKHNLVTNDHISKLIESEGEAIAAMSDISEEHRELFGTRLNARELRREAISKGKTLETYWMEKFGVQARRDEVAAKSKKDYEDKLREEGRAEIRSQNLNPLTRTAMPSMFPQFTKKTGTDDKTALPWQGNQDERRNDRVNKVMQNLQQKGIV